MELPSSCTFSNWSKICLTFWTKSKIQLPTSSDFLSYAFSQSLCSDRHYKILNYCRHISCNCSCEASHMSLRDNFSFPILFTFKNLEIIVQNIDCWTISRKLKVLYQIKFDDALSKVIVEIGMSRFTFCIHYKLQKIDRTKFWSREWQSHKTFQKTFSSKTLKNKKCNLV